MHVKLRELWFQIKIFYMLSLTREIPVNIYELCVLHSLILLCDSTIIFFPVCHSLAISYLPSDSQCAMPAFVFLAPPWI